MAPIVNSNDFLREFTVEQAAYLIVGLSPRFHKPDSPDIAGVVQRMREDIRLGMLIAHNESMQREEIHRWLLANALFSDYSFKLQVNAVDLDAPAVSSAADIDPSDRPEELDIANMAFRAVARGYGDKSETFRNRLIAYLNEHHARLTNEATQRITTVANADKARGRKKRDTE